MSIRVKMGAVVLAAMPCLFAHAADYYLTEDATDWSEKSSYTLEGAASDKILTLASNVYVAPSATLKAEGMVVVSRLTLDPAGMGALDGFTFAESGVLSAGGDQTAGQPVELPYAFTNAKGVDNIEKWAVSVGGKVCRGWTITRKDDKFVLTPSGVMLIVR